MRDDVDEVVTLTDYLRLLRRRKWLFGTVLLVAPVAALFLTLGRPMSYAASAKVLLNDDQSLTDSLVGGQGQYVDPARAAQTQAELARVFEVTRSVVRSAHVPGLTSNRVLEMSKVVASPDSDFLTFSVIAPKPGEATHLADTYADSFVAYRESLDDAAIARARAIAVRREKHLTQLGLVGTAEFRSLQQQLSALDALQAPTLAVLHDSDRAAAIKRPLVRNVGLGIALGIVLGLLAAFFRDLTDTRVTSPERIRAALRSLPLLGRVPSPPSELAKRGELVMLAAPTSEDADSFRVLRANFDLQVAKTGARTVMITSGIASEGKSTTAANLAVALARAGRKVILVDFDLRGPDLHHLFDVAERPGLVDVALGELDLDDVLAEVTLPEVPHQQKVGRLEVLPVGGALNPDELRVEFVVERVLDSLREEADCVLIDAGPLLPGGDAIALSSYVDAILVVVRLNEIAADALDDLSRTISSFSAIKLGYVLTGIEKPSRIKSYSMMAAARRGRSVEPPAEVASE